MISSDAIFTVPWIFHDEESLAICRTPEATAVRDAEQLVRDACPAALVVRTNAFGWSPTAGGWIEDLLAGIEERRMLDCDCIRHATPILATDLAEIVDRAWQEELTGVFHIAGAERISPMQFAQRLADQFDLPWLTLRREQTLVELPQGFGAGETSLQTKKIRKALCVAMPMLSEGLARLRDQRLGTDEADAHSARPVLAARVA
jgi:dTDP-4-dehydrorhamnose reductase